MVTGVQTCAVPICVRGSASRRTRVRRTRTDRRSQVGGIKGKPLLKKIVTKKDLIEARRSGYTEITIKNSTILTDVACEYIREKNIKLNISQSVR